MALLCQKNLEFQELYLHTYANDVRAKNDFSD